MARRMHTYAIRLAVEGGGQVKAELVSVGQSGEQSLKRIETAGDRASGGLKGLGRQAELLRTGIRTLGGALIGVTTVGGLAALVDRSISAADAVGKTADRIGVGVEALQELRFAAKASGVEQQTLDMALQRFTRRAAEAAQGTGEARDALAQMGIALRDQSGNLRRSEDLLGDVNKEVLRRAFEPLQLPYSGDNVHGEFGWVADWAGYRAQVATWVSSNSQIVHEICQAILRRTAFDNAAGITAMIQHVTNDLLPTIDQVVQNSLGHHALSERLASHGVLPMFGFPTRVRYLYHGGPPSADGGWPPERGVVDRQLDIAISQFAPGAQTVKDDQLLTSVGVVDYYPSGGSVVTSSNPLGNPVRVGVCRRCQALVETPAAIGGCPFCAAPRTKDDYRTVDLSEPPGFMTWWSAEAEYNGSFEFTPRALRARMGRAPGSPMQRLNFEVDCGPARIHRVNDNGGEDFLFQKIAVGDIWIVDQAFQRALQDLPADRQRAIRGPQYDTSAAPLTRALASIASTDVLVAGIKRVPVGVTLNPANPEARAAWYSFGFLARRAAAVVLDVAESELDVGIQPVMDMRTPFAPPSARIFVSDSLENGAGYSTHLGTPAEFERLLQFMLGNGGAASTSFYGPIVGAPHEHECSSSCHRCLRDYGNMPYHPLLDWRLALDMARLALDPAAAIELAHPYWSALVQRTAAPYFQGLNYTPTTLAGLPAGHDAGTGEVLILIHPLWDQDPSNFRPELSSAVAQAESRGWRWKLRTLFRAVRFPYE